MHQDEEHKTAVDKNVHKPPEVVFPQYSELEQYIEDKDFQKDKDFGTEKSGQNSFNGRKKSGGG